MIEELVGVNVWTEDLERLLIFYRDVLGLRLHHHHHGNFANFVFGHIRLNLGWHDMVQGRASDPYRIMINLGVEFIREPEQEIWGGWVSTLLDPDGNTLQLLQGAD
jgi:catechol 2,3-dioxygenase-like lactoylglutathione lyase family enzyme